MIARELARYHRLYDRCVFVSVSSAYGSLKASTAPANIAPFVEKEWGQQAHRR